MGNFFSDPFGGSFVGRVYTKMVTGNKNYSVLNPEKNNGAWSKSQSTNDKFAAFRDDGNDTKNTAWKRKFLDSEATDTKQTTQQPSTWQNLKTKVSNWWNGNKSSTEQKPIVDATKTFPQSDNFVSDEN